MSLKLGNTTIAGISRETKLNAHSLLDFKWTDHILNEMSWLRADTFSWQSGDVYTSVYNLLVSEYQNGTEETEGSITFKRSPNGYKITTDESGVSALFNETGVAWYYILDTENRRFKLPRSKYNAYASQIAVRGNGIAIGITNGSRVGGLTASSNSGATLLSDSNFYGATLNNTTRTTNGAPGVYGITTDPTKSGMVADLPTQELHLYFYVGKFSQTATEQTAGITTEILNTKADIDLSNILSNIDYVVESKTPTTSDPTWYRVYKSGWVEQGGFNKKIQTTLISLPIKMQNTNYTILVSESRIGNYYISVYNKTTTDFTARSMNSSSTLAESDIDWQVSGQGA